MRIRVDVVDSPARIICNCTFDGPAVGLSTIHCFNCDGKGFDDDFYGFTIHVEDFHEFFVKSMRAIKIHIQWSPFSDSRMSWVPWSGTDGRLDLGQVHPPLSRLESYSVCCRGVLHSVAVGYHRGGSRLLYLFVVALRESGQARRLQVRSVRFRRASEQHG